MAVLKERRKFQRSGYPGTVHLDIPVNEDGKQLRYDMVTGNGIDASAEGIGFHAGMRLEPGSIIRIHDTGEKSYHLAVIRWSSREHEQFRTGALRFQEKFVL